MDHYYRVLGIGPQASLDELKKAYREKAKLLHPDRNKAPDAHEHFILLNEAYEYVLKVRTSRVSTWQSYAAMHVSREEDEREKAKARAREYARMRYEEFVNSPHYRSLTSISTVLDYLYAAFGIAAFIIVPVVLCFVYGINGVIMVLLFMLITFPLIRYLWRQLPAISMRQFSASFVYIIRRRWFIALVTTLFNLIVFLKIGLQTLIPTNLLFSSTALLIMVSFGVLKWGLHRPRQQQYFYACCIVPLFLSMFLALNFLFSSESVEESRHFHTPDMGQESTYIRLEDDAYEPYLGIRVFLNFDQIRFNNTVTYTFRKGLFGPRVMTDFRFSHERDTD